MLDPVSGTANMWQAVMASPMARGDEPLEVAASTLWDSLVAMQWIAANYNVSCKEKQLHNLVKLQGGIFSGWIV